MELQLSFTAEHAVVLAQLARVGLEAVFKHERDGVAVAQILSALKTEAGPGIVSVDHFEFGHRRTIVQIYVGETKAGVNNAVRVKSIALAVAAVMAAATAMAIFFILKVSLGEMFLLLGIVFCRGSAPDLIGRHLAQANSVKAYFVLI